MKKRFKAITGGIERETTISGEDFKKQYGNNSRSFLPQVDQLRDKAKIVYNFKGTVIKRENQYFVQYKDQTKEGIISGGGEVGHIDGRFFFIVKGKEEEIEIFKKINEINKRKEDIKNSRIKKSQ